MNSNFPSRYQGVPIHHCIIKGAPLWTLLSHHIIKGSHLSLRHYAGFRLACRSPLCRMIIACCFRVAALSGHAALALSPSGIAPELNRIQLSVVCRGGQSGKDIDLLARRCLPLGHPSAASGACAFVQISSSKRQCGEQQASLKAALRGPPFPSLLHQNDPNFQNTPWDMYQLKSVVFKII